MNSPQQIFNPQFNALQTQMNQLQDVYNQINNSRPQQLLNNQINGTIPFVNGLMGAKSYLKNMAPNSSAAVFDKEDPVFYTLSVDANGVAAPIKIGRFEIEDAPEEEENFSITKKDFDSFKEEVRSMISNISKSQQQKEFRKFKDTQVTHGGTTE